MKSRKHILFSSLFIFSSGTAIGAVPVSSQSKLIAGDAFTASAYGWIVSSDGDTAIVSAFADFDGLGAAYVYERTASGWQQVSKLTASDGSTTSGGSGDSLGMGASISGNTIVLGAPLNDHSGGADSGGVYVYVKPADGWPAEMKETVKLTAPDGGADKAFGGSVSLKGSTLVVGATGRKASQSPGEVFIYDGAGSNWSHKATLSVAGFIGNDRFGTVVDTDGNTVIVGAFGTSGSQGSVYVYNKPASGWVNAGYDALLVASDGEADDYFGGSVAVDGGTILIGANGNDDAGSKSGSAYLFTRSGESWAEQSKITASDAQSADNFGYAVDIAGDTVVVGASNFESAGAEAIYLFTRSGSNWTEQGRLNHPDGQADSKFGLSVAVDGSESYIMTGAMRGDAGSERVQKAAGAAYLYELGAINKIPVAVDDSASTDQDTAVTTGNVLANDSDDDGDTLSIKSVDGTSRAGGSIVNNGDGTFTYIPRAGFSGSDSFNYTVTDGNDGEAQGVVNIVVNAVNGTENKVPVVVNDSASTTEDTAVTTGNVLANDSDDDGDTLGIKSADSASAQGGTVVNNEDGTFTYTPKTGFSGNDSFNYIASDGNGGEAEGVVNVTVNKKAVKKDKGGGALSLWVLLALLGFRSYKNRK